MTQLQLYHKIRSLVWRKYLSESIENIESEIIDYMRERNCTTIVIAGFSVKLFGENLVLEKLPFINLNQLEFDFSEK
ncbi:MAG: hypothetical protein HOC71_07875 [Candidatus Latescibacteria bacterium]|jgi:hypothetical protein|nr:hypothetical protein [Candidatus Latescibacterota bacterium]